MKRMALGIEYDGTGRHGWQKQPDGKTVQDILESAIFQFTQTHITTTCAGRTDAGVHATEQVVHLDTEIDRRPDSWVRGLNTWLPPSVAVRWAYEVQGGAEGFHARSSAVRRRYRYLLYNSPVRSPLWRHRAGWVFCPLAIDQMREGVGYLLGEHDFSAFRSAECQSITPWKTLHTAQIERQGNVIVFTFEADAFLHHMIRNIIGSLVYVGKGNRPPEWMKELLESKDRSKAAPTFMPDGLYLSRIFYDPKWGLPQQDEIFP